MQKRNDGQIVAEKKKKGGTKKKMTKKKVTKKGSAINAMDDVTRLEQLLRSDCPCIAIVTHEEEHALQLIQNALMAGKREFSIWSASEGIRGGFFQNDEEEQALQQATESPNVALAGLCQAKPGSVCVTLDLAEHLKEGKTLRLLRDLIRKFSRIKSTLILVDHEDKLPPVVASQARFFRISLPDEKEIRALVTANLRNHHHKSPIEIGISKRGFKAVIRNLRGLTRQQIETIITEAVRDDDRFTDEDLNIVMASKRQLIQKGGLLEYIQTPLALDEIGGLQRLKTWLSHRKNGFQPEAREFGLTPPRGVLMLGVQGAGKSLCAKAIATAWQQPLLRLDPSKLYASYVGQSEQNLTQALEQTEMMAPVVLWIDEIEKAFASAASRSSDGGLSQRMFGTLLTWMQDHSEPVFLVATANDIEALPPELLRKGRFDEIFFVDLPSASVRERIFEIHLKKRKRDPQKFDCRRLAQASEGFSGAEIEQAVLSALHEAFGQKGDVDTDLILAAVEQSVPLSVTMAEKIDALRRWAQNRCVPAD